MTQVDVGNTNPNYWEKILADSDLSISKEVPQMIEISAEEFKEITNLELLPEEDYEKEDDPVINFNAITRDADTLNADHSGLSGTNEELRTKVGSDETFFEGHRIIKPRRGNQGNKTGIPRTCPDWAKDNLKIQKILLGSFPKLATHKKQRTSAGRWARIIQLYYRKQMTHGQICSELGLSLPAVFSVIRSIDRTVLGKSANGTGARGRKIGRPKKVVL